MVTTQGKKLNPLSSQKEKRLWEKLFPIPVESTVRIMSKGVYEGRLGRIVNHRWDEILKMNTYTVIIKTAGGEELVGYWTEEKLKVIK